MNFGCCISLLVVLGRKGIEKAIDLPLSAEEKQKLKFSARVVREAAEQIEELQPTPA
jgi:malate/lactate dehydrogenase